MNRIVLWCGILIATWNVCPAFAQENVNEQDERILARLYHAYNVLLKSEYMEASSETFMNYFNEVERNVKMSIDSLQSDVARRKAELYNYNGYLLCLGTYIRQKDKKGIETIKDELEKRMIAFDLDSPDLELLSDIEIINLCEWYYNWAKPKTSPLERATCVLYNVKSEKVRRAYAFRNFVNMLQYKGYSYFTDAIALDFELCCKDSATLRDVRHLKEKYMTINKGNVAFDFEMEDERGNIHRLSDFRGKFVFIDVWNALCHVCVEDLPVFLQLAQQYGKENIVFMPLSLDIGAIMWKNLLDKKNISRSITHYRCTQRAEFVDKYCIYGIPRYILIDTEGKFVDAWNRSPKEPYFETEFERKCCIKK